MSHATLARRRGAGTTVRAVVAAGLAGVLIVPAAGVLGVAAPAFAGGSPHRVAASTPKDPQQLKWISVSCPGASKVYAPGGGITYGADASPGGVAIRSVVPSADLSSVTVVAQAMPWQQGAWSVSAIALCDLSTDPVVRQSAPGAGAAGVDCPHGRVFGAGFRVEAGPADARLTRLDLADDLTRVEVTAEGPHAAQTEVTAIAVCHRRALDMSVEAAEVGDGGWPLRLSMTESVRGANYALGAWVVSDAAATIDALVPGEDDGESWVRAALLDQPAAPGGQRRRGAADGLKAARDEDPDGTLTMEAALIGTFH